MKIYKTQEQIDKDIKNGGGEGGTGKSFLVNGQVMDEMEYQNYRRMTKGEK